MVLWVILNIRISWKESRAAYQLWPLEPILYLVRWAHGWQNIDWVKQMMYLLTIVCCKTKNLTGIVAGMLETTSRANFLWGGEGAVVMEIGRAHV